MKELKKIQTKYGVTEYRLQNGLRVLYKEEKAAPVVAVCITFHVGSRNEAAGHTGSTHILEHLLFKDSKNFNKANGKNIAGHLDWLGAYVNATTWLDRTNYFELLPDTALEEALALEADRMRGSRFTDEDLASEMTVVRNEYERGRNNPFELLDEEIMYKAFSKHPYRIPTIGTKEDIENSTAARLRKFYDIFYWPNNATLSVMGNVSWRQVEKLIVKYFAPIPPSPHPIPRLTIKEPEQTSPRKVLLKKPLGITIASLAYKVPEGRHKDYPTLLMLATVLAGGFSSRLQKALVDRGLASDLSVFCPPLFDPGVATFTAHLADGVSGTAALGVMRKEIAALIKRGVSKDEVAGARERILAQSAYERDGVFTEVRAVSEATAAGDWTLGYRIEDAVKRIKPADIVRVAKKYFIPQKETSGILMNG
ncbi:MAG: insulinase family protein [Patescibacteria group bacterium]|nr:insulinase family protein [Patescibacteria group bacterium]